jgi:hypothetical protein
VVIGREGRNLVLDPDLYVSEEAANDETNLDDIAGIFPVLIQAKVEEPEVVAEPVSIESDEQVEEEGEDEIEDTEVAAVTDTIEIRPAPQGLTFTIWIPVDEADGRGIVNVFDQGDGPITNFIQAKETP